MLVCGGDADGVSGKLDCCLCIVLPKGNGVRHATVVRSIHGTGGEGGSGGSGGPAHSHVTLRHGPLIQILLYTWCCGSDCTYMVVL